MSNSAGSYASSSALSPAHYRLVQAFEQAKSPSATLNLIGNELLRIKSRWGRTARTPAEIHHDLVLALYCLSQRPYSSGSSREGYNDDIEWLRVEAVKLAGIRKLGYRACDMLFDRTPHQLKLLLINSIRIDLYATSSIPPAEIRWTMGLRAIISENLISSELAPAVQDRVVELLACPIPSIRRLALAAQLALIHADSSTTTSPLVVSARNHILLSLAPPETLDDKRSPPSIRPETDPRALAGLVDALSDTLVFSEDARSTQSSVERVELLLGILGRVSKGESKSTGDVSCPWLSFKVLRSLSRELVRIGEVDISLQSIIITPVLEYINALGKTDLAIGLFSSALDVISHLASILIIYHTAQFSTILNMIRELINDPNPNLRVVAFRCLRTLPVQLWTSEVESTDTWGEKEWGIIMAGLENREKAIRREVLLLLNAVDPTLVILHLNRLHSALENIAPGPTAANQQTHLLSLLLHASSLLDDGSAAWSQSIYRIVESAKSDDRVLGVVVVETIERFRYVSEDSKAGFASRLLATQGWKQNLTLVLLVAATAGEGSTSTEERESAAGVLVEYLRSSTVSFLDLIYEPILISILRLVSRLSAPPAYLITQFDILEPKLPASLSTLSQRFRHCITEDGFVSLARAGKDRRSDTLVGFYESLEDIIEQDSRTVASEARSDGRVDNSDSKPLRYDSYAIELPQDSTSDKGKSQSIPERRNELAMERRERGGNGGNMSESLMTAGALALLVESGRDGDDSDSEEEREVRGEASELSSVADPFLL